MSGNDSVGTLLADIADLLADGTRTLGLADKRLWGPDEHEQMRALEDALDEARRDFQELSPLVNGQCHYEHDRHHESLEELRALRLRFKALVQGLRDWCRAGGPINPVWVRDTLALQRHLHRAQCRAARRIFSSATESSRRCLGAFIVQQLQQQQQEQQQQSQRRQQRVNALEGGCEAMTRADDTGQQRLLHMVEGADGCARIGGFERFGDRDIAFICDFCDGHLIWEDLEAVPMPPAPSSQSVPWQTTGLSLSEAQENKVICAPLVVANHVAPPPGDWQAGLLCPLCETEARQPQDEDDDDHVYHAEYEFEDVAALQTHFEWQHMPGATLPSAKSCRVM
ncbi:hypothetical protein CDD81_8016 [Ophiocordyceps australis]|uniref:Uncharacterized protein n=1 Tax=Ophiocordyceps australis TaxID=1399860 RepID=A0A2C5Y444_9HYPO|nr:hypothetical protein CDD81_8016 [Ophiocordyceps australis]